MCHSKKNSEAYFGEVEEMVIAEVVLQPLELPTPQYVFPVW